MFAQAASTTLRILSFKAGPQDFPFAPTLTQTLAPLAALAMYLEYRFTLSAATSLAQSVAALGALALFTWQVLRLRNLQARFQQTYNALLATGLVLTLFLLPAVAMLAPTVKQLAEKPELMGTIQVPAAPTLLAAFLSLWNLAVSAHIYRHALNIGSGMAVAAALMGSLFVTAFAAVAGSLFR